MAADQGRKLTFTFGMDGVAWSAMGREVEITLEEASVIGQIRGLSRIADAIHELADATRDLAEAVRDTSGSRQEDTISE